MIFRRKANVVSGTVIHRVSRGDAALVVALHGYGATETQIETLVPLELPVTVATPRAPHVVEPGYGWWLPETTSGAGTELAPEAGVDAAVETALRHIRDAQASGGFHPDETFLFGYSQGAMLALTIGARHPDAIAAVATGAGFLLPDETVIPGARPLDVLVMNGTHDPLTRVADHDATVDRFRAAGHRVTASLDPVPHVIDEDQAQLVSAFYRGLL